MIEMETRNAAAQLTRQLDRGRGAPAAPESQQHRQAHRMRAERQPHEDPGDHPPVAPAERVGILPDPSWVQNAPNTFGPQRRNSVSSTTTTIGAPA